MGRQNTVRPSAWQGYGRPGTDWDLVDLESSREQGTGPTTALPGTAAKIAVMRQRYSEGLPVFHEDDPVFATDIVVARFEELSLDYLHEGYERDDFERLPEDDCEEEEAE